MNLEYVDYSSQWFCDINNEPLPDKRSGKFILIANGSSRWAVFSPAELSKWHANIAERFCRQHNIAGTYNAAQTKYNIHDNEWHIMGGGKWEVDQAQSMMVIFGRSDAYGRVDLKLLAKQLQEKEIYDNIFAH